MYSNASETRRKTPQSCPLTEGGKETPKGALDRQDCGARYNMSLGGSDAKDARYVGRQRMEKALGEDCCPLWLTPCLGFHQPCPHRPIRHHYRRRRDGDAGHFEAQIEPVHQRARSPAKIVLAAHRHPGAGAVGIGQIAAFAPKQESTIK